jgi:hypothetical protein
MAQEKLARLPLGQVLASQLEQQLELQLERVLEQQQVQKERARLLHRLG